VRSLRQARAGRLGALQRKLPQVHMLLLWILSANVLVSFPLLGAGTQIIGGYKLLTIEGLLFGVMTAGIVLTLRVSYWCKWRLDEHFIDTNHPSNKFDLYTARSLANCGGLLGEPTTLIMF
jgi:hypothetical protein